MLVCSVAGTSRLPDGERWWKTPGPLWEDLFYAKTYKYNWCLQLNATKTNW